MLVTFWSLINIVVVLTHVPFFSGFHVDVVAFMLLLLSGVLQMQTTVSSGTLVNFGTFHTGEQLLPADCNFTLVDRMLQGVDDVVSVSFRIKFDEFHPPHPGKDLLTLPFGHAPIILTGSS